MTMSELFTAIPERSSRTNVQYDSARVSDGNRLSTRDIPQVFDKRNANAVIILDDAANVRESKTRLKMWQRDYPALHFELLPTEKGTAIFHK